MIQTWFKIFYRNSKKNWLNLFINILGLTLGFAGLLLVLLYLNDEESYNATNPYKEEVYRVLHKMKNGDIWANSTSVEGIAYKEAIPEITDIYLSYDWYDNYIINVKGKNIYSTEILRGEPEFFRFFPFKIIAGSVEKFEEARNHIAVSEEQAQKLFGKTNVIGEVVKIFDKPYIVTTVYKIEGKHYYQPNAVIQFKKTPEGHWGNFNYNLFCKLNKGVNPNEVVTKINDVVRKERNIPYAKRSGLKLDEWEKKYALKVLLDDLKTMRLHTIAGNSGPEGKGNYKLILISLVLSILLIIISCVNFINLSTASATQRAKEVGVKKTLGLSKFSLVRQYTLEIVLQGIVAMILGLLLVEFLLPYFNEFMNKNLSIFNWNILVKISVIAIITSLIIGSVPAVYLSNFKSIEVLKGNISRSKNGVLIRNAMLGFQFLISGLFLIGSLVMLQQINYMINKDVGFSGEQVLIVSMNGKDRYKKYLLAKKELIKHPNIEVVTSNRFIPGGYSSSSTEAKYNDKTVQSNSNSMDFEYLDMVKMKILKGRSISSEFASDTLKNILINETLAKMFGIYENPIGKKIDIGFGSDNNDGKNMNIIGMIKDNHTYGFDQKIPPTFFLHWKSFDWLKWNLWKVQFKIKPENMSETIAYIEKYWKKNVEQGYPFDYTFLDKQFAKTYEKHKKQKSLFLVLTSVIILISLLGLFALATLTIQQRLKEVAIRKTLGASVQEIMIELIKSFIKIVLISSVFLIPIAYYFMQNWLDDFVYRIDMPILPYIITPLILIILVIAVVGLKAYNATKVDLIKYLKFE